MFFTYSTERSVIAYKGKRILTTTVTAGSYGVRLKGGHIRHRCGTPTLPINRKLSIASIMHKVVLSAS